MDSAEPPYLRIAAELRARIEDGTFQPGDRLPSTRRIVQDFGVAMATATKALAVLQQDGLAISVAGVGTVVADGYVGSRVPRRAAADERRRTPVPPGRGAIVGMALDIADEEGLPALTMRRIAAELGTTTVVLHRHVTNREHVVLLMADAVFGEFPLPDPQPSGWRARLEAAARQQWSMYRRHPWLAQAASFTRPLITPRALAHSEWLMRAMEGTGLDAAAVLHATVSVSAHVRGMASNLEPEAEARANSGVTEEQWMDTRGTPALSAPQYPHLADVPPNSLSLDSLFEFGLQRLLDGIGVLIDAVQRRD